VADHRAPTPSAAAERAVPVRADLIAEIASLNARQTRGMVRYFDERRTKLNAASRALPKPDEILALVRQRFDNLAMRLAPALKANVQRHRLDLVKTSAKLTLAPIARSHQEQARRLAEVALRQTRAMAQRLVTLRDRLSAEAKLFAALNYTSVLARGFALVRDANDHPVKLAASVRNGQSLKIQFADDTLGVVAARKTTQGELF
jgi:exodeoxyribonuclease VII large subunit